MKGEGEFEESFVMDIRMVLKSTDSFAFYRNNKPYDFHVHLPRPLTLNGQWTVSLLETCLPSTESEMDVYIYSNLCEDTIVRDKELPLLRRLYLKRSFENQIFKYPYKVSMRLGQSHMYEGCRWSGRIISTEKYICDTLIEVEKSIKECMDPHTCLILEYGKRFTKI